LLVVGGVGAPSGSILLLAGVYKQMKPPGGFQFSSRFGMAFVPRWKEIKTPN